MWHQLKLFNIRGKNAYGISVEHTTVTLRFYTINILLLLANKNLVLVCITHTNRRRTGWLVLIVGALGRVLGMSES